MQEGDAILILTTCTDLSTDQNIGYIGLLLEIPHTLFLKA